MEYGDYYLVRPAEVGKLTKLPAKSRKLVEMMTKGIKKTDKWIELPIDEPKLPKLVDVAVHFNNYEWSAWDFDVFAKGKCILSGCFGENGEAGIDESMNELDGDVAKAASLLAVDPKKLAKILDDEDMEKFAKLVGFEILPITPTDLENFGGDDD